MPGLRLQPERYLADPGLDRLRTRAQDLASSEDWSGLWALRDDLERDEAFWPDLWQPLCALAARHLGLTEAVGLLAAAVDAGFGQPELFEGKLESAFGTDPRWSRIRDQMTGNVPPPPLALTDWPALTPSAPLGLLDLPDRAGELRDLAPAPAGSAWQTAVTTLDWVTHRWRHANAHMEIDDAVECLRRVGTGQRFACVEYSLVLCQVLNALGIPSRRLALRQDGYHIGLGRAHAVSEAWIDDLGRWVVLDGQNGLYWTDTTGAPLGAVALQDAARSGAARPGYVTARSDLTDSDATVWFSYFAHVSTSAGTWAPDGFGLVFQRDRLATSGRLEHRPEPLYPDLAEIGVQAALDPDGGPALRLISAHPFAVGFCADGRPLDADLLPLDRSPGGHELILAVRTSYGTLAGRPLRWRCAEASPGAPAGRSAAG